jgi:hypothetical protein
MRPENWLRRRIKPLVAELGITLPVNLRVLRRTFATQAQGLGNPRDVQAHLRHTDIGTMLNEYTQAIPESVRKLLNGVANNVMSADTCPRPILVRPILVQKRLSPGGLNTILNTNRGYPDL